jgi:hypothetical protein
VQKRLRFLIESLDEGLGSLSAGSEILKQIVPGLKALPMPPGMSLAEVLSR